MFLTSDRRLLSLPERTGHCFLIASLLLFWLAAAGCTLIHSARDASTNKETTVIVGRVHADFAGSGPIIVAAYAETTDKEIAQYTVLHEPGEYELMVDQGSYSVFAFWDTNSNLILDAGEPVGECANPRVVKTSTVGVIFDIDIVLASEGGTCGIPAGSPIAQIPPLGLLSRQAGAVTALEDPRFAEENGGKGFWEPGAFFREFGGNIYFLEPYDPNKIPILFIHGAGGTPFGWRTLVDHLDRTRFQPWFFYYPSGSRIDSMAYLLLWKLVNLQAKYQFNTLYITAHSMGGLVARSFIVNYGRQFPCVKLFIALATPWGGDRMAEYGVQQSPVVIPSWIDMQPESDFIKALYRLPMPDSVSFYMFSGHKGNRNIFQSNNDGTISLASILDARPQAEAKMHYAFNEDHTSILSSKDVHKQYLALLDQFDDQHGATPSGSGGYLRLRYSYDFEVEGVRPGPTLILHPAQAEDADTVLYLRDEDRDTVLGPFPPGEYVASMVSLGAKPVRNRLPVTIEPHAQQTLEFLFQPDGVIHGCVAASLDAQDTAAGMPDYRYRAADSAVRIQSVSLHGTGIQRTIRPIAADSIDPEHFLSYDAAIGRADFCVETCFALFDLPAGEYTLEIQAEGYRPIEKHYKITPGKIQYFRVTELTPD